MFENLCSFIVSALVEAVEMKLPDETSDFFEFEILWQNLYFKLFSIYNLYPCSVYRPFDDIVVFWLLRSLEIATCSISDNLIMNLLILLEFLGMEIDLFNLENVIRNFIIENYSSNFIISKSPEFNLSFAVLIFVIFEKLF